MYADHDQNHLPHREHSISHANDDAVRFPGLLPPFLHTGSDKKKNKQTGGVEGLGMRIGGLY